MSKPVTLKNAHLEAHVLPFGATLAALYAGDDPRSLTLGFKDPADYQRIPLIGGSIVGPLANRLANGLARIDGQVHQMPRNENGRTSLHSGPEGLHRREWHLAAQTQASLTLRCALQHGECGLPGNREIEVTYGLKDNALALEIRARSDRKTLMNLAHHPYWATNAQARLKVSASRYLPVDAAQLPTGQQARVEGTAFDLRQPRPIPAMLDHNYILSEAPSDILQRAAVLEMPHYRMKLQTTAPGLQVYAGANLPNLGSEHSLGWPIAPLHGTALEPQLWPDAPNHPLFPSVLLQPDTEWSQSTVYTIET